jgi:hypothetical protein
MSTTSAPVGGTHPASNATGSAKHNRIHDMALMGHELANVCSYSDDSKRHLLGQVALQEPSSAPATKTRTST